MNELPFCECGCGRRVSKVGNRFIVGHNSRGKKFSKEQVAKSVKGHKEARLRPKPQPQLCECGCGLLTKPGNRFIDGHYRCKTPWKPKSEPKPCGCGCGELTKPGNDYINGHSQRGVSVTEEAREKMRISAIGKHEGKNNGMYGVHRYGSDAANYGNRHTPVTKKKISDSLIGGLVGHHYIYDHNNPSLNIIQMTRSDHSKLHRLLEKLKYIIPHINITIENIDTFIGRKTPEMI